MFARIGIKNDPAARRPAGSGKGPNQIGSEPSGRAAHLYRLAPYLLDESDMNGGERHHMMELSVHFGFFSANSTKAPERLDVPERRCHSAAWSIVFFAR